MIFNKFEMSVEEVESRNKALVFTIMLMLVLLVLMLTGCAQIRTGEARDIECRVLGLDASLPVPFAQGVNVVNVRLGWVETRYVHTYGVGYKSDAKQSIKYIGDAHRITELSK